VLGDGNKAQFNTANWSITNDTGGVGSVEFGPDGWVKLKLVITNFSASNFKVVVTDAPTYGAGVAAGKVFFIGGRNVSRQSFTHYKTTGSPFYGPRFDHDPSTGQCKGLLIEESRSNLTLQSGNLSTWSVVGASAVITPNVGTSPVSSGSSTATRVTELPTTGTHRVRSQSTSVTSGVIYSASIWIKSSGRTTGSLSVVRSGEAGFIFPGALFDLNPASPTIASNGTIEAFDDGWYRISVSGTSVFTGDAQIYLYLQSGPYLGVEGLGFDIDGAQLEVGAFPTSYIPTAATVPVVRSADVCSITGSAFSGFYNQPEGTLLVSADEFRRGSNPSFILRIAASVSPSSNRYSIGSFGNKTGVPSSVEFYVTSNSSEQYIGTLTSANSDFKAALAYKVDDMRGSLNGLLAAADTPPSALTIGAGTMSIGSVGMHIASIRYYRKRLTNEKLVTLTTP
jgi:hypothetical protein